MKKNIVSFCVYGLLLPYWRGAVDNIYLCKKYYPNFICRFYICTLSHQPFINLMIKEKKKNPETVELHFYESSQIADGMFWRFMPAIEDDVDIFLSRDTDCRITEREQYAVNEWLQSDKNVHIVRDHKSQVYPMTGGLWGCRNGVLQNIGFADEINNLSYKKVYGADQRFLSEWLYPKISKTAFEHSAYGIEYNNPTHQIQKERLHHLDYIGRKVWI